MPLRPRRYHHTLLFWIIMLSGAFIRVAHFPNIPPGLNGDEASSAYEAYCLLKEGTDRWGNPYPSYFPSWGQGQNVLLSYLSVPVIALFGLNIFSARLVMLIFGILALPLCYYTLRPMGRYTALLGSALLAFAPWHFMLSRWALESNLVPFFMLLGCCCLSRALHSGKKSWILVALLPFALALYCYGTTVFILPPMFLTILLLYFKDLKAQTGTWLLSGFLFLLVSFPFALSLYNNYLAEATSVVDPAPFFSAPRYLSTRLSEVTKMSYGKMLTLNLEFLLSGWNDKTVYNLMSQFPLLFPGATLLGLAGAVTGTFRIFSWKQRDSSRPTTVFTVILAWFLSACLLFFFIELNINRFNHFFLPCIVMAVTFLDYTIRHVVRLQWRSKVRVVTAVVLTLSCLPAIRFYFDEYEDGHIRLGFNKGLHDAIRFADTLPASQLFIADHFQMPYVYTLFYLAYPPGRFQREVQYEINKGAYEVKRFGKYLFTEDQIDRSKPWAYVSRRGWFEDKAGKKMLFENELFEIGIVEPSVKASPTEQ